MNRIFLSPPHMSGMEEAFVREAFESNYIAPLGPMVDAFEREFCERVGIPHGVAVSSGTAACHLALRLVGVGPGDLVIASSLTFIGRDQTKAMKQDLQYPNSGKTDLVEEPMRWTKRGQMLIETGVSLISAGTERMLVEFGRRH